MRNDKANEEFQNRSKNVDSEAYFDFIEDYAIAEKALAEYEANGTERTTLYREYWARRLESKAQPRE